MKIKKDKAIEVLSKVLFLTAQNAFSACLILFVLALIFGVFLFYQYSITVNMTNIHNLKEPFSLKQKTYEMVLSNWQTDEKKFQEANLKEYKNFFLGQELTQEDI